MTIEEVAARLRIPVEAAKIIEARALAKLRAAMLAAGLLH